MPAKPQISDTTRAAAVRLWEQFPSMKPVGAARQSKHLAELEALLVSIKGDEQFLLFIIHSMKTDRYRVGWVASFETIAHNLPKIRAYLDFAMRNSTDRESYTARWAKGEPDMSEKTGIQL